MHKTIPSLCMPYFHSLPVPRISEPFVPSTLYSCGRSLPKPCAIGLLTSDEKNCYAMFVFARMVVVYNTVLHVCGTNDVRNTSSDCGRVMNVEWLNLRPGTFRLLLPHNRIIFGGSNSPFKPLVNCRAEINMDFTGKPCDSQLEALAPLFSNGPDISTPVQHENFGLRLAFTLPYTNQQTVNSVTILPFGR